MIDADVFVGRERHLAALSEAAIAVTTDGARTVIVSGRPGVGSTTLVERFAERLDGFRVVTASASRAEQLVDYALAGQIASSLASSETGVFDESADVPSVARRLIVLIEALERVEPLLLVVDDLQWADDGSLAALRFALRRLGPDRVMAVLVGRRGRGRWDGVSIRHDWPDRVVRVDVDEMEEREVVELASAVRGVAPSDRTVTRLIDLTEGNTLFLRALLDDAELSDADLSRGDTGSLTPMGDAVRSTVASFAPVEQRLLEALAVLDAPATPEQLSALSPGDADTGTTAAGLVATGFVRWIPGEPRRVAISSRTVAQLIEQGLHPDRFAELHRGAAAVTSGSEHWWHIVTAAGGPDAALEKALVQAGGDEVAARRYVVAARYYLWARRVAATPERAAELLLTGIRLLVVGGSEVECVRYRGEAESLPASPERAEALGLLDLSEGHVASARDRLTEARSLIGMDRDVTRRGQLDVTIAYVNSLLGAGAATVAAADAALASTPLVWPEAARAFRAFGIAFIDGPSEGLRNLGDVPEQPTDCTAEQMPGLIHRGMLRGLVGRFDEASADLVVAARRRADSAGFLGAQAHVHLVWCRFLRGDWVGAARDLDLGFAAADEYGRSFDQATLYSLSAVLAASRGDSERARSDLERAAELATGSDYLGPQLHLATATAAVAQADGSAERVVEALRPLTPATTERDRHRLFAVWWLAGLGDAQVSVGELAAADRTLDELRRYDSEAAHVAVSSAWLEGRVLSARGDRDGARSAYEAGVRIAAPTDEPVWHRALLQDAYGRFLLGEDDPAAVEHLRVAATSFERMGAFPYLERARAAIADPAAETGAWWRDLTSRERDVASLVGRGWTNPEIATELYVSRKTVEYHLRNTYIKLHITSRHELRDLVQATR